MKTTTTQEMPSKKWTTIKLKADALWSKRQKIKTDREEEGHRRMTSALSVTREDTGKYLLINLFIVYMYVNIFIYSTRFGVLHKYNNYILQIS